MKLQASAVVAGAGDDSLTIDSYIRVLNGYCHTEAIRFYGRPGACRWRGFAGAPNSFEGGRAEFAASLRELDWPEAELALMLDEWDRAGPRPLAVIHWWPTETGDSPPGQLH